MSHIVTIKTEIRDAGAVRAACQRLRLPPPVQGTHKVYSSHAAGLAVQLPKWRFPAVCQLIAKSSTTTSMGAGASKST